jgi:hypothetical protein
MQTKSPPWFRLYSEVLSDRKIQRICHTTQQPKALVIGVWTVILSLASESPERGKLIISEGLPVTFDEVAFEAGLDCDTCQAIINAFISTNMLQVVDNIYEVSQWNARQFASDNVSERVARHRERKKQAGNDTGKKGKVIIDEYTQRSRNVTSNNTVTPPESESESDKDKESLSATPTPAIPSKKAKDKIASPKEQGLFLILARLCRITLNPAPTPKQVGQLDDTVKALTGVIKDRTFFAVKFETYWTTVDWRGKQGQPPTPPQIREVYGDYCYWLEHGEKRLTNANGQPPPQTASLTPEQMAAMRALNEEHQAAVTETTQRVNGLLAAGVSAAGVDVDRELRKPVRKNA